MKKKWTVLLLIFILAMLAGNAHAQEDADLLNRINALRSSLGLAPYNRNAALNSAAANHARWMVNTGQVSHTQTDGSTPRTRAAAAGYSSQWVSENIYGGSNANIDRAWSFWMNSNVHYRGIVNPNYQDIGIGIASGDWGRAFVLVFGNATGSWGSTTRQTSGSGGGNSNRAAPPPPPSFVVGVDTFGNIMHEIQPGDTLGDIALLYGYTWDDIPYMMELNELDEAGSRELEIGAVFLVPPESGTYTPTPNPSSPTPSPTATATQVIATNTPNPTATLPPTHTPQRIATAGAPPEILTRVPVASPTGETVTLAPTPTLADEATVVSVAVNPTETTLTSTEPRVMVQSQRSPWFIFAIGLQIVVVLGAAFELVRRFI